MLRLRTNGVVPCEVRSQFNSLNSLSGVWAFRVDSTRMSRAFVQLYRAGLVEMFGRAARIRSRCPSLRDQALSRISTKRFDVYDPHSLGPPDPGLERCSGVPLSPLPCRPLASPRSLFLLLSCRSLIWNKSTVERVRWSFWELWNLMRALYFNST